MNNKCVEALYKGSCGIALRSEACIEDIVSCMLGDRHRNVIKPNALGKYNCLLWEYGLDTSE